MKREVVEVISGDSVYVLDKSFVDMMRSKRSFLWKKVEVTDEMLVQYAVECNKIYERRDLILCR